MTGMLGLLGGCGIGFAICGFGCKQIFRIIAGGVGIALLYAADTW
jgi:hypothetical protein